VKSARNRRESLCMVFWGLGREIGDFLGLRLASQIFNHGGH
jgi:hypothetical protein